MTKAADAPPDDISGLDPRSRIIAAGVQLVAAGGTAAATTRAIAAAASVQAPTIFRHFGDKSKLLDAIAARTMAEFLSSEVKTSSTDDPVQDLRAGMEAFIRFGVGNPGIYLHMFGRPGVRSAHVEAGYRALQDRIRRVAMSGRLIVGEAHACDLLHAMARGTVFEMLDKPAGERDAMVAAASNAALASILGDPPAVAADPVRTCATTMRANLGNLTCLSPGERLLMDEVLGRILAHGRPTAVDR